MIPARSTYFSEADFLNGMKAFKEGAEAYRNKVSFSDCPSEESYFYAIEWRLGWTEEAAAFIKKVVI